MKNIHLIVFLCGMVIAASAMAKEYHVAISGRDSNSGAKSSPLRTIQRAADLALPGDIITVHEGIYRERVTPSRGGVSDSKRITYQAARGEKVVITGSEMVKGWQQVTNDTWVVTLPNEFFGSFNPYSDVMGGDWFDARGRLHHTGAVYLNGTWLMEAVRQEDVMKPAGAPLWFGRVDAKNTTLWAQFGDADPNRDNVEINVRRTVFTPDKAGVNFITVRGFKLCNAATPWAPPTAGQIGLVTAYWCKGWIIEDNEISYSKCCGIVLGKYGDEYDNKSANTADGYVKTIERALANGWNRATVGTHIVRRNMISHCEQAGIVGSLGAAFSTITDNTIHDIHVWRLFSGCEQAGIKFHGAIDVVISRNHIYRTNRGLWLDWMAQGTRVTANLFHDNASPEVSWSTDWEARTPGGEQDMFVEVNHGPFLVDNNLFLSPYSLNNRSQAGAYVHNLFLGAMRIVPYDGRQTPYLKPHSTEVAGLQDNPGGDDRIYNNIFAGKCDLRGYDKEDVPSIMSGNVFLKGALPAKYESTPLLKTDHDPGLRLFLESGCWFLEFAGDKVWKTEYGRKLVTTDLLGNGKLTAARWEHADGSPCRVDTDYAGAKRDRHNPSPGPFENMYDGKKTVKVWPRDSK